MTKTFFVAVNQTPLDADCCQFRQRLSLAARIKRSHLKTQQTLRQLASTLKTSKHQPSDKSRVSPLFISALMWSRTTVPGQLPTEQAAQNLLFDCELCDGVVGWDEWFKDRYRLVRLPYSCSFIKYSSVSFIPDFFSFGSVTSGLRRPFRLLAPTARGPDLAAKQNHPARSRFTNCSNCVAHLVV